MPWADDLYHDLSIYLSIYIYITYICVQREGETDIERERDRLNGGELSGLDLTKVWQRALSGKEQQAH